MSLKAFDVEKKVFVGVVRSRKSPAILRCTARKIEGLHVSGDGGAGIRSKPVNVKAFSRGVISEGERGVGQTVRWMLRVCDLAVGARAVVCPFGYR